MIKDKPGKTEKILKGKLEDKNEAYCDTGLSLGFIKALYTEINTENKSVLAVPKCSNISNCVRTIMSIWFISSVLSKCTGDAYTCVFSLLKMWLGSRRSKGWAPVCLLRVSPNTGRYSWPDQVDVRLCPSSAPYFHMNAKYAKGKKTSKILVPQSHQRVRKHTLARRRPHRPTWQITYWHHKNI